MATSTKVGWVDAQRLNFSQISVSQFTLESIINWYPWIIWMSRNGQIFDIRIVIVFNTSPYTILHKRFIILILNKFVFLENLAWMLKFTLTSSHGCSTTIFSCADCTWTKLTPGHSSFHCPRGLTLPGGSTGNPSTDDVWLIFNEVIWKMVCVVEYGENIGTLRNLFRNLHQAEIFVKQIIALSDKNYECIGPNQWYCSAKNEYVKIENS